MKRVSFVIFIMGLALKAVAIPACKHEVPASEQVPDGISLIQYTWNRLIADFITAIRRGDKDHTVVPHLPTLTDGLNGQEIIEAARRAEAEQRWVSLTDLK